MQPNNNMANSTAPAPAPMTTPMNPGSDVVFKDKPKKNKGMIIGMIILAFLAAGGIGFGVWAYLDGNSRVTKKDEQISELQNQLAEQPENEETIIDEDTESDINTANYIYIGEWNIKINTNNQLKNLSYYFDYRSDTDGEYLYINGVNSDAQNTPSFLNTSTEENWLACISRYPIGTDFSADPSGSLGQLIFSDENYDYYYRNPQSTFSSNESDIDLEVKTVDSMKQIFTNKDNYSKI